LGLLPHPLAKGNGLRNRWPKRRTSPISPFPVFPVFPVSGHFTELGDGKGVVYREDRRDREGFLGEGCLADFLATVLARGQRRS